MNANTSAPVGVLAVIDSECAKYARGKGLALKEARAAVAELVEAASNPVITESASDGNWKQRADAINRLRAALAKFT